MALAQHADFEGGTSCGDVSQFEAYRGLRQFLHAGHADRGREGVVGVRCGL